MSQWNEIREKNINDIDIHEKEKEISFYAGYDDQGSIYVYMKIELLVKYLKDKKII